MLSVEPSKPSDAEFKTLSVVYSANLFCRNLCKLAVNFTSHKKENTDNNIVNIQLHYLPQNFGLWWLISLSFLLEFRYMDNLIHFPIYIQCTHPCSAISTLVTCSTLPSLQQVGSLFSLWLGVASENNCSIDVSPWTGCAEGVFWYISFLTLVWLMPNNDELWSSFFSMWFRRMMVVIEHGKKF